MNSPNLTLTPNAEYCPPVVTHLGEAPTVVAELLGDAEVGQALAADTAEQFTAANARSGEDLENGRAASSAILALGCEACTLAGCEVRANLNEQVLQGEALRTADQLITAPTWLNAVRVNRFGPERFALLQDREYVVHEATENGGLTELLGGVTNDFGGIIYDPTTVPEYAGLTFRKTEAGTTKPMESHIIKPLDGAAPAVEVVDARDALNTSNVAPAPPKQEGILLEKLIGRMMSVDGNGIPQILTADNKMQKRLAAQPNSTGTVFELRMEGKNRMYVLVAPTHHDQAPYRITILGSHGDNEQDQQRFIGSVIASATRR